MGAQTQVWPLGLYMAATFGIVAVMLGVSWVLGGRHRDRTTHEPFESGMPPTGTARGRFPVSFYVMAILFVIFDIETVLFVSWAIALREAGWKGFFEMLFVSAALIAALIYLWREGALDWGSPSKRDLLRNRREE